MKRTSDCAAKRADLWAKSPCANQQQLIGLGCHAFAAQALAEPSYFYLPGPRKHVVPQRKGTVRRLLQGHARSFTKCAIV